MNFSKKRYKWKEVLGFSSKLLRAQTGPQAAALALRAPHLAELRAENLRAKP